MKKPRTYKQLQQDPRVADWSDERSGGMCNDGLWIYLAPGWVTDEGLNTIHEWTVAECCDCLSWARYSPDEWRQALQGQQAHELKNVELLPAG